MDERRQRLGLRAVLGLAAVVAVVAIFWAASALAAGEPSTGDPVTRDSPPAADVQNEGDRPGEDCPERDGEPDPAADV
jgi:hypothetical protein